MSQVAPGTVAKLYFDLLGFGEKDAEVVLNNVHIVGDQTPPVASNDTATTDQAQPVTINVLSNDSDANSTLDPTSIAIKTNPANGVIALNSLDFSSASTRV